MDDAAILDAKRRAAAAAVRTHVRSGMAVGLGTGSTAAPAVEELGRLLAAGELADVVGVATSERTAEIARRVGVPLASLDERPRLDVAIDGADEIAPDLDLVKGLGGALLREKVVASAAALLVVVADASKLVQRLGTRAAVPVEVIPFAVAVVLPELASLGCDATLRADAAGVPFTTDEGNRIVDCRFADGIADPDRLGNAIHSIPGVVEHGLFLGMAREAFVAGERDVERLVV